MGQLISQLTQANPFIAVVDILCVAAVFYWLLGVIGGTRAVPVVRGLVIVLVLAVGLGAFFQLSSVRLQALNFLIQQAILPGFIVAIPIVFQPELRRALEKLGTSTSLQTLYSHGDLEEKDELTESLCRAVFDLAYRRIGALIVIERETGLEDVMDTGTRVDADVAPGLLESVFTPGGPLHDGAVIISRGRLAAAGCVLPLSDNLRAVDSRGTRHRAALGLAETSDALVIIVSEETGTVSIAQNGRLVSNFSEERLRRLLSAALVS